jgi:maltokinase
VPETLPESALDELGAAVTTFTARRPGWDADVPPAVVVDAVQLRAGRPGLVDVVAEVGPRLVHVPLGLRQPGDELATAADGEDPVLGIVDDGGGEAVAFDALRDSETAALLLAHVAGRRVDPRLVRQVHQDEVSVTMAMEERYAFTVFNALAAGPRPDVEMLWALDEAGFNHLPAPLQRWRRGDWDLGMVQEHLAGASIGLALALTSVRDLYASGGPPELAGGDFGAEAHRLGTTAARMHLALERSYGRLPASLGRWTEAVESALRARRPQQVERPETLAVLSELRALSSEGAAPAGHCIRTHGDFHLGRVWRTEQGWYVGDFGPAGVPPGPPSGPASLVEEHDGVPYRSPLADVADMMWSLGQVATSAADERDPNGSEGLGELATAWEQRNRSAFLAGYLGVPGISVLLPRSRDAVRVVVAALELERASRAAL